MAQRKIKVALSSTLADPAAIAAMWLDNEQFEFGLSIVEPIMSPHVSEYTFEATGVHTLKIAMINDYFDGIEDLNLIINYIAIANEDNTYTPYTYFGNNDLGDIRTEDRTAIITHTIWNSGGTFEITFDINNLTSWIDWYQHELDNPPV